MKVFKIFFLFLTFLGFFKQLDAKVIFVQRENVDIFLAQSFQEQYKESKWLGLLYIQKEYKFQNQSLFFRSSLEVLSSNLKEELCLKFASNNFQSDAQITEKSTGHLENDRWVSLIFYKNPDLVESWKILSNGSTSLKSINNINAVHAFRAANPQIADDAIQAAFDGLKASRKQPFINALESCADNTNLISSLKKSKLASVDEIKDALNKMRDYRTGKAGGGNYGYLESDIPGVTIENKMWESISLERAELETHIFDAIEATGSSGTWLRITDSEYRMLNDLAKKLNGVKGKSFPEITGTLKIVSENPYCTSCQGVIQQFSEMFPNIEIKLIDGVR